MEGVLVTFLLRDSVKPCCRLTGHDGWWNKYCMHSSIGHLNRVTIIC